MSGAALASVSGSSSGPVGGSGSTTVKEQQVICLTCEGWSQGETIKLARTCEKPTSKGREVLSAFRRGLGPNPRLREKIDKAIPVSRLEATLSGSRDVQSVSSVPRRFSPDQAAPQYAQRMAALLQRARDQASNSMA